MGVHGLWKLIEPAGKPVPVETLENKVLAVDVSIWLHQLMKGYQNPSGSNVSNAYLLGLFTRVCKLLFTNVKPVFVFDGGVPQLKRKTIAARQQQKNKSAQASEKLREQLLKNLLKQKAVSQVLEEIRGQSSPKKKAPDMYELPPLPAAEDSLSDVEEVSTSSEEDVKPIKLKYKDLHTIDVNSAEFKSLPADIRHDILTELKETRKQSSWGRVHEMPEESGDFSKYQMSRLLKRRSVQVSLEEAEKEMGGRTLSLADVEVLMAEGGIEINPQLSKRIASDDVTRYIYVRETGETIKSSQNEHSDKTLKSMEENNFNSSDIMISKIKEEMIDDEDLNPNIKIKEEVVDNDELSDVELVKEVEAIEMAHNIVKVENEEFGTEDMFDSESSSEGVIIDDLDLIKDNSGLSQEQILAVINQQNMEKSKTIVSSDREIPSTSFNNELLKNSRVVVKEQFDDIALNNSVDSSHQGQKLSDLSKTPGSNDSKILDSLYFKMNKKIQLIVSQKAKQLKSQETLCTAPSNKKSKHHFTQDKRNINDFNKVDLSALASNSSDSDSATSYSLPCQVSEMAIQNTNSNKDQSINEKPIHDLDLAAGLHSNISDSVSTVIPPSQDDVIGNINNNTTLSKIDNSNNEISIDNINSKVNIASELSSSESDSDFIDVLPLKDDILSASSNSKTLQEIHIKIKPNQETIEDDIFADIFLDKKDCADNMTIEKNIPTNIKNAVQEINISRDLKISKDSSFHADEEQNKLKDDVCFENKITEHRSQEQPLTLSALPLNENRDLGVKSNEISLASAKHEEFVNITSSNGNMNEVKRDDTKPFSSSVEDNQQDSSDIEDTDNPDPKPEASTSNSAAMDNKTKRILNTKQLEKLQDILETKEREILMDQNREDRLATSLTDQMYQEAQELLRLFGVPYIVAPMEAEAQCAFLDAADLTQGTITDDSDIWLFGGRKVYKNFFDQKKFVLEFQACDIHHYFKLGRSHLVLLALLVGSDYTVGLQGVGPVTALEILATFPPPKVDAQDAQELLTSLNHFKEWWQSQSQTSAPLAKKLKNIDIHQGFPSPAVVSAYLHPLVNDSKEPFSWGSPDISGLRDYAERKFGWSRDRTDQILLPVIKKRDHKISQLTLHTFFGAVPNISAHREQMSRRVQSAVNRLEGGNDDFEPTQPRPRHHSTRGRGRAAASTGAANSGARGLSRGRGRGRNPLDNDDEMFIHESVGKAPEVIPQREKDRQDALKRKQHAVEILKNKKVKRMKKRKNVRQIKPEAGLSESSSDDN